MNQVFDPERPSAARLFSQLEETANLSGLEAEARWIESRLEALQAISRAAHVEEAREQLERRRGELDQTWVEAPPAPHSDFYEALDPYSVLWEFFERLSEASMDCLKRSVEEALKGGRQFCSLHLLNGLVRGGENAALTLLRLADFRGWGDLKLALVELPRRPDSGEFVAPELTRGIGRVSERSYRDEGTEVLLMAILHPEALAYGFLEPRCRMEILLKMVAKLS